MCLPDAAVTGIWAVDFMLFEVVDYCEMRVLDSVQAPGCTYMYTHGLVESLHVIAYAIMSVWY